MENILSNWRIERAISKEITEAPVLPSWDITRQSVPNIDKRKDATVITFSSPRTETRSPKPVKVTANLSNVKEVTRLLRCVGEEAALREHRIIVDTLSEEGTEKSLSRFNGPQIHDATQKVNSLGEKIVILMSPRTTADLTHDGDLFPEWKTKPEAERVESKWFAGIIFGYEAYWSPEVEEKNCFVFTTDSVGIRRSKPTIIFQGSEKNGVGTGFEGVYFYEEMLCWCINSSNVLALKLRE